MTDMLHWQKNLYKELYKKRHLFYVIAVFCHFVCWRHFVLDSKIRKAQWRSRSHTSTYKNLVNMSNFCGEQRAPFVTCHWLPCERVVATGMRSGATCWQNFNQNALIYAIGLRETKYCSCTAAHAKQLGRDFETLCVASDRRYLCAPGFSWTG